MMLWLTDSYTESRWKANRKFQLSFAGAFLSLILLALIACGGSNDDAAEVPTPKFSMNEVLATEAAESPTREAQASVAFATSEAEQSQSLQESIDTAQERLRDNFLTDAEDRQPIPVTLTPAPLPTSEFSSSTATPVALPQVIFTPVPSVPVPTVIAVTISPEGSGLLATSTPEPTFPVYKGRHLNNPTSINAPDLVPDEQDFEAATVIVTPTCEEHFRRLLFNFREARGLSLESIIDIDTDFRAARPDCVDQGWNPQFSTENVCDFHTPVPGAGSIPLSLVLLENKIAPTSKSPNGDIIVHFSATPFDPNLKSCWWFNEQSRTWHSWTKALSDNNRPGDGVGSMALFGYEFCDNVLRSVISRSVEAGVDINKEQVSLLIARMYVLIPDDCFRHWKPLPARFDRKGECPVQAPTGLNEDNYLVINWAENQIPHVDDPCWIRYPDGTWVPDRH